MAELMTLKVTEPGLFVEARTQSWKALWEVDVPVPLPGVFDDLDSRLFVVQDQECGVADFVRLVQPRDLALADTGSPRRIHLLDLLFHSPITAQEALEALLVDIQQLLNTHLETRVLVTESRDTGAEETPSPPLAELPEDPGTLVLDYRGERIVLEWSVQQEIEGPGYWRTELEVVENTMGSTALFLVNDALDIFFGTASPATEDGTPEPPEVNDAGEGRLSHIRFRHLAMTDARDAVSSVANDLLEYLGSKIIFRDNMTNERTFTFWSPA